MAVPAPLWNAIEEDMPSLKCLSVWNETFLGGRRDRREVSCLWRINIVSSTNNCLSFDSNVWKLLCCCSKRWKCLLTRILIHLNSISCINDKLIRVVSFNKFVLIVGIVTWKIATIEGLVWFLFYGNGRMWIPKLIKRIKNYRGKNRITNGEIILKYFNNFSIYLIFLNFNNCAWKIFNKFFLMFRKMAQTRGLTLSPF